MLEDRVDIVSDKLEDFVRDRLVDRDVVEENDRVMEKETDKLSEEDAVKECDMLREIEHVIVVDSEKDRLLVKVGELSVLDAVKDPVTDEDVEKE